MPEFTKEDELRLLELRKEISSKKEDAAESQTASDTEDDAESHVHSLSRDQDSIFCRDCNNTLIDSKDPAKLRIGDALSCPTCSKNIFDSITSKLGYYEKKGEDYIIHTSKKKTDSAALR